MKHKKRSSINVFGKVVKIKYVKQMPEGDQNVAGLYYSDESKILILSTLPDHILEEVLYHELFHAVLDRLGFRQSRMSHDVHEMLCEAFSRFAMDHMELKKK